MRASSVAMRLADGAVAAANQESTLTQRTFKSGIIAMIATDISATPCAP